MKSILFRILLVLLSVALAIAVLLGAFVFCYDSSFAQGAVYSSDRAKANWHRVSTGMELQEVTELLGPPFPDIVRWGHFDGEEHYIRHLWAKPKKGYGYFQCVWFDDGKVVRKMRWEDD